MRASSSAVRASKMGCIGRISPASLGVRSGRCWLTPRKEGAKLQPSLHKPFYGYYYGILFTQGPFALGGLRDYARGGIMNRGFGFVAYPAKYGVTGVMTFIIDQDGIVYEKDLGATTSDEGPFMRQFNPDGSWAEVKE